MGVAADVNDVVANFRGTLLEIHSEFPPLGQGLLGRLILFN